MHAAAAAAQHSFIPGDPRSGLGNQQQPAYAPPPVTIYRHCTVPCHLEHVTAKLADLCKQADGAVGVLVPDTAANATICPQGADHDFRSTTRPEVGLNTPFGPSHQNGTSNPADAEEKRRDRARCVTVFGFPPEGAPHRSLQRMRCLARVSGVGFGGALRLGFGLRFG